MENYEELEGKEVYFHSRWTTETKIGIVIGCDPDIGITIVEKNTNRYLMCLIGPSSPTWRFEEEEKERFKIYFEEIVRQIKTREYYPSKIDEIKNKINPCGLCGFASASRCSFGQ